MMKWMDAHFRAERGYRCAALLSWLLGRELICPPPSSAPPHSSWVVGVSRISLDRLDLWCCCSSENNERQQEQL